MLTKLKTADRAMSQEPRTLKEMKMERTTITRLLNLSLKTRERPSRPSIRMPLKILEESRSWLRKRLKQKRKDNDLL
jgi:hypothetical protein